MRPRRFYGRYWIMPPGVWWMMVMIILAFSLIFEGVQWLLAGR